MRVDETSWRLDVSASVFARVVEAALGRSTVMFEVVSGHRGEVEMVFMGYFPLGRPSALRILYIPASTLLITGDNMCS